MSKVFSGSRMFQPDEKAKEKMRKLRNEGLSLRMIATRFNCGIGVVEAAVRGMKKETPKENPDVAEARAKLNPTYRGLATPWTKFKSH